MDDAPPDPFADPVLGPLLERALARYGPHVTEAQLAELRGALELLVAAHADVEGLAALAERASAELCREASQAPKESGVVAKRGKRAARGTGTGGGGDR